jgi:glycosyltransferase involved in cell wall biosynthesis
VGAPLTLVVVLARDEERNLPGLLRSLAEVLGREPEPFRVVVVDDGSRDGTAAVCAAAGVACLSHPVNLGVARAFDTGLRRALAEGAGYVFTMEGDGSNDPATLPAMLAARRRGADVVIASRHAEGGAYVGFPPLRRALSAAANRLAGLFLRVPGARDYTLFYRGYRGEALRRAAERFGGRLIESRGFAANAELLRKVALAGAGPCAEVPTSYRYDLKRSPSRLRVSAALPEYFRLFCKAFFGIDRGGARA